MIVVSDTSPLIHLAAIGRLDLLQRLYGEVFVPLTFLDEVTRDPQNHPDSEEIRNFAWLQACPVPDDEVKPLLATIDRGEAEALVLAGRLKADLLLIDDGKGRRQAAQMNLKVIGLLGVLLAAKKSALIVALADTVRELERKASVWWSDELKLRALVLANEAGA